MFYLSANILFDEALKKFLNFILASYTVSVIHESLRTNKINLKTFGNSYYLMLLNTDLHTFLHDL